MRARIPSAVHAPAPSTRSRTHSAMAANPGESANAWNPGAPSSPRCRWARIAGTEGPTTPSMGSGTARGTAQAGCPGAHSTVASARRRRRPSPGEESGRPRRRGRWPPEGSDNAGTDPEGAGGGAACGPSGGAASTHMGAVPQPGPAAQPAPRGCSGGGGMGGEVERGGSGGGGREGCGGPCGGRGGGGGGGAHVPRPGGRPTPPLTSTSTLCEPATKSLGKESTPPSLANAGSTSTSATNVSVLAAPRTVRHSPKNSSRTRTTEAL